LVFGLTALFTVSARDEQDGSLIAIGEHALSGDLSTIVNGKPQSDILAACNEPLSEAIVLAMRA
jgi:hypothetical protein